MKTYSNSTFARKRVLLLAALMIGAGSASADKSKYTAELSGSVQADAVAYSGDTVADKAFGSVGKGQNLFPAGGALRSANISVKGALGSDNLSYVTQLNLFNGNATHLSQAYVQYAGDGWSAKVGQMGIPFGLAGASSTSRKALLGSAAVVDSFAAGKHFGLRSEAHGDMFTVSAAAFVPELNEGAKGANNDKLSFLVRGTLAPIQDDNMTLHFGANFKNVNRDAKENTEASADLDNLAFTAKPGVKSRGAHDFIVHTGSVKGVGSGFAASGYNLYGAEVAALWNAFAFQAEYMQNKVTWDNYDAQMYRGWYGQVAYTIVGEGRKYDTATASIGDIKSTGDYGAWEVAARYDELDLTNGGNLMSKGHADHRDYDGKAKTLTLGVNWVCNSNLKVQGNWFHTTTEYRLSSMEDKKLSAFSGGLQVLF